MEILPDKTDESEGDDESFHLTDDVNSDTDTDRENINKTINEPSGTALIVHWSFLLSLLTRCLICIATV